MTPRRILVVSASPQALNVNNRLPGYLAAGLREAFPDADTVLAAYEAGRRAALDLNPDLAVVFGSVMLDETDYHPLANAVRRGGGRLVFWLHDDPYEFDAHTRVVPLADAIFTNDLASLDVYPPVLPVHHLALGAYPAAHHRPVTVRAGPELFFCGHLYGNRRRLLEEIAARVPDLDRRALFLGTGVPTGAVPGWQAMTVANDELAGFTNAALAVINVGRDHDLANARLLIRASTPGPRTFEAGMSGAAQIVVGDGFEIEDFYAPGAEVLLADGVEGVIEHWERLARDPSASLAIGRAAQDRTLAEHTYTHRARRLVSLAMA
ncbi:MAG TPA: glycosyltransferase [Beijerinckiaceae bacterium]|jgi:spore maturation protein CgeB